MAATATPLMTWLDWVEKYVNTANHMMIAMISVYTIWVCWQLGHHAYTLHTLMCTIGYQFLMCESIMSMYKHNSWSNLHQRKTQQHLHWILQAFGSGSAIAGMVVYYVARDRHLLSAHSQLGFASAIFTCLSILNGTTAFWSRELMRYVKPVYTKLLHNACGIIAFVTGMGALILGFDQFPIRFHTSDEVVLALQIGCGFTIVLSLAGALRSFWRLLQGALPGIFYREDDEESESDSVPMPRMPNKIGTA